MGMECSWRLCVLQCQTTYATIYWKASLPALKVNWFLGFKRPCDEDSTMSHFSRFASSLPLLGTVGQHSITEANLCRLPPIPEATERY
jgi:hypothetical protein